MRDDLERVRLCVWLSGQGFGWPGKSPAYVIHGDIAQNVTIQPLAGLTAQVFQGDITQEVGQSSARGISAQ